jgi:hypothetical protein
VKATPLLFRRSVMAAAIAGGFAWLSERASFFAGRRHIRAVPGSDALAVVCARLGSSPAIGEACLRALPGINSKESLARAILGDIVPVGKTFASGRTLAQAVRDRSRDDFQSGRIVTVNGWIFSMTETRLYALATMLSQA